MTHSIQTQATHPNTATLPASPKTQTGSPKPDISKSEQPNMVKMNTIQKKLFVKCWKAEYRATIKVNLLHCQIYTARINDKPYLRLENSRNVWIEKQKKACNPLIELVKNGSIGEDAAVLCHDILSNIPGYMLDNISGYVAEYYHEFWLSHNSESESQAVQASEPVVLADIAEYSLTDAETVVIKSIEIVCSESNLFADGEILTLSQYNDKATVEALKVGRGEGYAKININILFDTGEVVAHRHDINADYPTLTVLFAEYGVKAVAATIKESVTYKRVYDRKQLEPTPPNNARNSEGR